MMFVRSEFEAFCREEMRSRIEKIEPSMLNGLDLLDVFIHNIHPFEMVCLLGEYLERKHDDS